MTELHIQNSAELAPLAPLVVPDFEPEANLSARFAAFHKANPHVADAFEVLTAQWLNAGHRRVGMKAVAERARWESGLSMASEGWKINNSYVAFYARILLDRHPEWADAITLRTQHGGGAS